MILNPQDDHVNSGSPIQAQNIYVPALQAVHKHTHTLQYWVNAALKKITVVYNLDGQ